MTIAKKVFNVLGILVSIVLSLILTAVLISAPLTSAVTSFLQKDTLHRTVDSLDLSALLPAEGQDEIMSALLETELANDLLSLYVDDLLAALDGATERTLTPESLNNLVLKHMDDLLPLVRPYAMELAKSSVEVPDGTEINWDEVLTEDVIAAAIVQYVDENGEELLAQFPSAQDFGIDQSVVQLITAFRGKDVLTAVITIAAVLSVLILLCRWVRFKGFMWLGIVYLISAAFDFIYASLIKKIGVAMLIAALPELNGVVPVLLDILIPALTRGTAVIAVLGVFFVAIFIVGRLLLKKFRRQRVAEAPSL